MQPAEGRRTKNKRAPTKKKCKGPLKQKGVKHTGITNMKIYFQ